MLFFFNVVAVLIFIKIGFICFLEINMYIYSHLDVKMSKFTEDMVILQVTVGHSFHNCMVVRRKKWSYFSLIRQNKVL